MWTSSMMYILYLTPCGGIRTCSIRLRISSTDCTLCHTVNDWTSSNFDHNITTTFPLTGAHTTVDCASCHTNGFTGGTPSTCVGCHQTNYNASTNPNHTAAKFSTDCKTCHTPVAWAPSSFNHNTATTFPLAGSHIGVSCISCHASGYAGISTDCSSCHISDYNATTSPAHATAKYPTDCTLCHTINGWVPSTFNHNTSTAFPLTGAHIGVDCISCHSKGYVGISMECVSCHQSNFSATTMPNHTKAQFSTDCKTCHTSVAWVPSSFNHNTATSFPLSGSHIGVSCNSCHATGFAGISTDCISCHLDKYNASTTPSHVAAQFPTDCKLCHSTVDWLSSTFNHNTTTIFPLTGVHTTILCTSCHSNGFTGGTPTDCAGCHINNFNATISPNHVQAKFPTDCKICHTTTAWIPNSFNHNTATTFPLTGSHIGLDCILCHSTGYIGISTDCSSCHMAKYTGAVNPDHVAAKFPTDCKICHTTSAWIPSPFNHSTNTTFPLTGSHITVACISCHTIGYIGIPTTCVSCHLNNYNATLNPNHTTAKFSTDCKTCHSTTAWVPSTYNHNTATTFPLTGSHIGLSCNLCHTAGFAGISTACVSCHLANYNATKTPVHSTSQFPNTCEYCHTTSAWTPSTYNHDTMYFPIFSSKHLQVWSRCTECHTTASNFSLFSCIVCHEHNNKTDLDSKHKGIKGYVYSATGCYTCHPRGVK